MFYDLFFPPLKFYYLFFEIDLTTELLFQDLAIYVFFFCIFGAFFSVFCRCESRKKKVFGQVNVISVGQRRKNSGPLKMVEAINVCVTASSTSPTMINSFSFKVAFHRAITKPKTSLNYRRKNHHKSPLSSSLII